MLMELELKPLISRGIAFQSNFATREIFCERHHGALWTCSVIYRQVKRLQQLNRALGAEENKTMLCRFHVYCDWTNVGKSFVLLGAMKTLTLDEALAYWSHHPSLICVWIIEPAGRLVSQRAHERVAPVCIPLGPRKSNTILFVTFVGANISPSKTKCTCCNTDGNGILCRVF